MCVRLLILCTSYTFRLALNGVLFWLLHFLRRISSSSFANFGAHIVCCCFGAAFCGFLSFFVDQSEQEVGMSFEYS